MGQTKAKRRPRGTTKMDKLKRHARVALTAKRPAPEPFALPDITPEARRHGDYHEAWTELGGQRRRVLLNRGGSTVQRWLNAQCDEVIGDSEKASIRYCQGLWARIDYHGPAVVRVDFGSDGHNEHEALAELSALKVRIPLRHWNMFENICRFEHAAHSRHAKVTVGFVASLIAMWRGL